MPFLVGDKVVHPHYGPGRIAGIQQWEYLTGARCYYVISIPDQGLVVHIPVLTADEVGLRPAMSLSRFSRVLSTLRGRPRRLPDDYQERQQQIGAQVRTGQALQLARAVRDLTWHRQRAHLTKVDLDLLKQGLQLLAAEMALVSGDNIAESNKLIGFTIMAGVTEPVTQKSATPLALGEVCRT
jgi:CarD family transcriptional regulator